MSAVKPDSDLIHAVCPACTQVNIASREAAVGPMLIDSLAEYAGAYNTVFLAGPEGQGPRPIELAIMPGKSGGWPFTQPV